MRRSSKKVHSSQCHYDVIDWLEPDWVFCTDIMEFIKKVSNPPIVISVHKCNNSMWQVFRQCHYLNWQLGAGVKCYVALYQQKTVAFIAVAHVHMLANYFRVSRLVVLPDYQGIGI